MSYIEKDLAVARETFALTTAKYEMTHNVEVGAFRRLVFSGVGWFELVTTPHQLTYSDGEESFVFRHSSPDVFNLFGSNIERIYPHLWVEYVASSHKALYLPEEGPFGPIRFRQAFWTACLDIVWGIAEYHKARANRAARIDRLTAAVKRIRELHAPDKGTCPACSEPEAGVTTVWPCATFRALDGETGRALDGDTR